MHLKMLRAKIHRATVTEANLNYVGSITIDEALLDVSGIKPYEWVGITSLSNGTRWETYVIPGPRGSGTICLNGSSARWFAPGDKVIVLSFGYLSADEIPAHRARVVYVDDQNDVQRIEAYEPPFHQEPDSTTRGDAR